MFVYGGCYQDYKCLNDIMMVNLEKYQSGKESSLEWCEIKQTGETPCERWGHSAVQANGSIFVFGYICNLVVKEKW